MQIYNLNTRNAVMGGISNPVFNLKTSLTNDDGFEMSITNVNIPNTIRQINTNTPNTINYNFIQGIFNYTAVITIPVGTYNINSLLLEIKNLLINSIYTITGINITTFNFTYDSDTNFASFSFSSEPLLTTISWTNARLNKMLGFVGAIAFSNSVNAVSTQPVNMNPINTIYLSCSSFLSESFSNMDNSNGEINTSNILLKIPINTVQNGYIRYIPYFEIRFTSLQVAIPEFEFKLLDNESQPIILSLDWSIQFIIYKMPKKNIELIGERLDINHLIPQKQDKDKVKTDEVKLDFNLEKIEDELSKVISRLKPSSQTTKSLQI